MKLAIIAGNGVMPAEIRRSMTESGNDPVIIGIDGEVEAELVPHCEAVLAFGQLGSLFEILEKHRIGQVLFAGGIIKRPDFLSLKLDKVTLKSLPKLLKIVMGGDDTVLGKISSFLASHDIEVVGVHAAAPDLLAGSGHIAGPKLPRYYSKALGASLSLAWRGARMVGELDAGQGAIAVDGRVIALEGAEGTDQMIARFAEIRKLGRLNPNHKHAILAKVTKPKQDLRADLPAIGVGTIETAARNGITIIAVEAGNSVILQRKALTEAAQRMGITVLGLDDESVPHD